MGMNHSMGALPGLTLSAWIFASSFSSSAFVLTLVYRELCLTCFRPLNFSGIVSGGPYVLQVTAPGQMTWGIPRPVAIVMRSGVAARYPPSIS